MKRAVSISLSVLLLYNAVGYYLLYLYASQQSRIAMVTAIPEPALQVVKFNLALYNPVPDTEAEWVDEEWTLGDKTYHIVKRQVKNDSLCLYYVRNHRQEALRASTNEIIKGQMAANHGSTPNKAPVKSWIKSFQQDYLPHESAPCAPYLASAHDAPHRKVAIPADPTPRPVYLSVFSPPPEQA